MAVSLAVQETLSNFFAGIYITLDKAFKVGNVIELDSGAKGKVIRIGSRSVKLRTFDNNIIIIPNSKVANSALTNLSAPNAIVRHVIKIEVDYKSHRIKVK